MFKIGQKLAKFAPKLKYQAKLTQKYPKSAQVIENPTHDKKCRTYPQNSTASLETYWAPCAKRCRNNFQFRTNVKKCKQI